MREFIPFQPEFRQAIPEVIGNRDYRIFRETLERIDQILNQSGIERNLVERILSRSDEGTPSERLSEQR